MSNRVLGILILLGFIGAGYIYYRLSYIPAQIKNQEIISQKAQEESNKPSFALVQIEKENTLSGTQNFSGTTSDRIEFLKNKNKYIFEKQLSINGKIAFINNQSKMTLLVGDKEMGDFEKVPEGQIDVQEVVGNENILFLQMGTSKFFYNLEKKSLDVLDLKPDVLSVKGGKDIFETLIKTKVGTFVYSFETHDTVYFHYFEDFVYYQEGYLGIVNKNDTLRIQNMGIASEFDTGDIQTLFLYYNPITKERTMITKTDKNIVVLYDNHLDKTNITILDDAGKSYVLSQITNTMNK